MLNTILPFRLWRSVTGLLEQAEQEDTENSIDQIQAKQTSVHSKWRAAFDEYRDISAQISSVDEGLTAIVADVDECDQRMVSKIEQLDQVRTTIDGILKQIEPDPIEIIDAAISRYIVQYQNLVRLISIRRKHMDDAQQSQSNLAELIANRTSITYRLDAQLSRANKDGVIPVALEEALAEARLELDDLQRQALRVSQECSEHAAGLAALQAHADELKFQCDKLEAEKSHVKKEQEHLQEEYHKQLCLMENLEKAVSLGQTELTDVMSRKLLLLTKMDGLRDLYSTKAIQVIQYLTEERRLTEKEAELLSVESKRRHSEPIILQSETTAAEDISIPAVWKCHDDGINVHEDVSGKLLITSFLVMFEPNNGEGGFCVDMSDVVRCELMYSGSDILLYLHNGFCNRLVNDISAIRDHADIWGNPVRFTTFSLEDANLSRSSIQHWVSKYRTINENRIQCTKQSCQPIGNERPPSRQISPKSVELNDSSTFISKQLLGQIISQVPVRHLFFGWKRLFNVAKDGMSLGQFYRQVHDASVCLLILQDNTGQIFGAFSSDSLRIRSMYFGSGETFVFKVTGEEAVSSSTQNEVSSCPTSNEPVISAFFWTGKNKFFVMCHQDCLSFGGGTHFAIFIKHSLRQGSSGACDTFNSPILAAAPDFSIRNFEAWGPCQDVIGDEHSFIQSS